MKKLQNGIYSFFGIVSYMAQLNLQWLLFTLLGGILLGIGPATNCSSSSIRSLDCSGIYFIRNGFSLSFADELFDLCKG